MRDVEFVAHIFLSLSLPSPSPHSLSSLQVVILGKAGALLKRLTMEASRDLELIFNKKVYLNLMVQEKRNYDEYDEQG